MFSVRYSEDKWNQFGNLCRETILLVLQSVSILIRFSAYFSKSVLLLST